MYEGSRDFTPNNNEAYRDYTPRYGQQMYRNPPYTNTVLMPKNGYGSYSSRDADSMRSGRSAGTHQRGDSLASRVDSDKDSGFMRQESTLNYQLETLDHLQADTALSPIQAGNLQGAASHNYMNMTGNENAGKSYLNEATSSNTRTDHNRSVYSTKDDLNKSNVSNRHNVNQTKGILTVRDKNTKNRNRNMPTVSCDGNRSILSNRSLDANQTLNRSVTSNNYLDSNQSVLSHNTEYNKSILGRSYHSVDPNHSINTTLRSGITPTHKQNGFAKSIKDHDFSQKSLNFSQASLNVSKVTLYGKDYGVNNSLISLLLTAFAAILVAILGLQLIFKITSREAGFENQSILSKISYEHTLEVTVAILSFIIMLDLACVCVCALQCFFAAKLLKCPQGEERAFKYLKECAGTRFVAVTGFFLSVPTFLLALILFMLMQFRTTPAIISTVVLILGILFIFALLIHSTYFWQIEKQKADKNVPPFDDIRTLPNGKTIVNQNELSTLV